ncbi:hypothetical protein SEUBUCD650_0M03510 [Saccharomyces eubayanus]|uniref:ESC1-like protein n=1 Tax=Saccharomyces eubayanus TaxID=1080349 RepID=A0ABN8VKR9_SACEU|nr:hypothetical protein SEUBUCD650_0M03510 [Saccharomyces eubayanus]
MSEEKKKSDSRAHQLNLTTPRRKLKLLSSLLDTQENSRTQGSDIRHNYLGSNSNKHRVAKPIRYSDNRGSFSTRQNHHVHDKSLHKDSTKALSWVDSLINRGKSILNTLEKEDTLFEQELEEERKRSQLHESLMNKYTGGSKPHQRLVDLKKSQYGTDTSFQNNDEIPLDSFITSLSPEVEDETPSDIESDEDEELEEDQSSIKNDDIGNSDDNLFGEENDHSDASIIILSDEEYAEEAAPQGVLNEDEYNIREEERVENKGEEQIKRNMNSDEELPTEPSPCNSSEHENYPELVEEEYFSESEEGDDVESSSEKYEDEDEDEDDDEDEEGTGHSIDFSKFMQPRKGNIVASNTLNQQPNQHEANHMYSEDDAFDCRSADISVNDESEDEEDQAARTDLFSKSTGSIQYPDEKGLSGNELTRKNASPDSASEMVQETKPENNRAFEDELVHGKEYALEESNKINNNEDQNINKEVYNMSERDHAETGGESEEDGSIQIASDESFYEDKFEGENYEAITEDVKNSLTHQQPNYECSPDSLYDIAAKAMLQLQQSENSMRTQEEKKILESNQGNPDSVTVSVIPSQEAEEQTFSQNSIVCEVDDEDPEIDGDNLETFSVIMAEKGSEQGSQSTKAKDLGSSSAITDSVVDEISIVNEDTVYYSLDEADSVPENSSNALVLEVQAKASAYEVIFSGSVYSSTSEDNSEIMPAPVEYTSPFMNNPFHSSNDEYENKNNILKSTLAALASTVDHKDLKTEEDEAVELYPGSKSENVDAFHEPGQKIEQKSGSDETIGGADSGNEDPHDENTKENIEHASQSELGSVLRTNGDKSIEESVEESYFSAINYTNIIEPPSPQEIIRESTSNVEGDSRLGIEDANEIEISTDTEDDIKKSIEHKRDSLTQNIFGTNLSKTYEKNSDNTDSLPIESIARDGDFDENLLEKPTNAEIDYNIIAQGQSKSESSQDSAHQEYATRLKSDYKAVDSRHRQEVKHQENQENLSEGKRTDSETECEANKERASQDVIHEKVDYNLLATQHNVDKAPCENHFEEDVLSVELGHEIAGDKGNESKTSNVEVQYHGNIEQKQETIDVDSTRGIIVGASNFSLSVNDHNEKIIVEGNDQEVKIKDAGGQATSVIQAKQEDNPFIVESISNDVIENASKNSENTDMETIQKEVFFEGKSKNFEHSQVEEENDDINDTANSAFSDLKQGSDQSVSGKNLESDTKPCLEVQHSNPEHEPIELSKPVTAESNVFSSPIRALETVVRGVKNVVDLAELFVKKIDVIDSEAEDAADISNGNKEASENLVSSNESKDTESTNISINDSDGDAKHITRATLTEDITARLCDNDVNHVKYIETMKSSHDEEELGYASDLKISEQKSEEEEKEKLEEPLTESTQVEQYNENIRHHAAEEKIEPMVDEKPSINVHTNNLDDVKRQQLLENLSDLQNYSQRLSEGSRLGTNQEKLEKVYMGDFEGASTKKEIEEECVGSIEEDSVLELNLSTPSIESEGKLLMREEKSMDALHSEPEEEELSAFEIQRPLEAVVSGESDGEEQIFGIIPSTDLPSDPPSDTEETTDLHNNSNTESMQVETNSFASPEVYEVSSDTPIEVLVGTGDALLNFMSEKDSCDATAPVLDVASDDSPSHNVGNQTDENPVDIKINEGGESESQAVDIPVQVFVKQEREEKPSDSKLEKEELKSNDGESLDVKEAEEISLGESKPKPKKKSRKRNYNSRRRKRKITEDSAPGTRNKKSRGKGGSR